MGNKKTEKSVHSFFYFRFIVWEGGLRMFWAQNEEENSVFMKAYLAGTGGRKKIFRKIRHFLHSKREMGEKLKTRSLLNRLTYSSSAVPSPLFFAFIFRVKYAFLRFFFYRFASFLYGFLSRGKYLAFV